MSKICLIIDNTILYDHVGVRRYIFSIYSALGPNTTLLKMDYSTSNQRVSFSEIYIRDSLINSNFFSKSRLLSTSKKDAKTNLHVGYEKMNGVETDNIFTCLPTKNNILEEYDTIICGAPWVYKDFHLNELLRHKFYCIAYDVIPNIYSIEEPYNSALNVFAYEHLNAYQVFLEHYAGLLSISSKTSKFLEQFFPEYNNKILTFPTLRPSGFENVEKKKESSEKIILLASPLDLRKGLDVFPDYLNALEYDKLIIFGRPRGSYELIFDFFDKIRNENIEWWLEADYQKQVELYQSARIVLFPSHDEGLGLPVIEALCCGTAVFVSDIEPLNKLVESYFILNDSLSENIKKIQRVIDKPIKIKSPSSHLKIDLLKMLNKLKIKQENL